MLANVLKNPVSNTEMKYDSFIAYVLAIFNKLKVFDFILPKFFTKDFSLYSSGCEVSPFQ